MQLTLPDYLPHRAGLSERDFKIELAVMLYEKELVSMMGGSHIAEIPFLDFQQEVGKRGVVAHYDIHGLENELKTLERLRNQGALKS